MIPAAPRVLIAVGPGDVVSQFQDWTRGIRTLTETSISYAMQSAEYCLKHGIEAHLVSCHARAEQAQEGSLHVANLPKPGHLAASGWRYHLREIRYAWMLAKYARHHQCQLAMIDSGTTHWFALFAFNVVGIPVVANFHNVYHPIGKPPQRLIANQMMHGPTGNEPLVALHIALIPVTKMNAARLKSPWENSATEQNTIAAGQMA